MWSSFLTKKYAFEKFFYVLNGDEKLQNVQPEEWSLWNMKASFDDKRFNRKNEKVFWKIVEKFIGRSLSSLETRKYVDCYQMSMSVSGETAKWK